MYNVWARRHYSMGRVLREYFVQQQMSDDIDVALTNEDLELVHSFAQRVTAEVVADMLQEEEDEQNEH